MIPKIIYQTVKSKDNVPLVFLENIQKLKKLNPDWTYKLYSDDDIREFIGRNFTSLLKLYDSISPEYGPAKADFFRYLAIYHTGGVYLDIKSTCDEPMSSVLDEDYLLSHWTLPGAGVFPFDLGSYPEFQQWHVIASKEHPFLKEVIGVVARNIQNYQPYKGVGKYGVLKLTGPIAYTQAILNVKSLHNHKVVNIEDLGFRYSFLKKHEKYFSLHYSKLTSPICR